MNVIASEVLSFVEAQILKQQRFFEAKVADKFVTYMGSTSTAGAYLAVSAHRLLGLEKGQGPTELVALLQGTPPRLPRSGEIATTCLSAGYVGYQVKTRPAGAVGSPIESVGGETRARGGQVYTLHHSPYMMTAFEKVPLDDVLAAVGGARFALLGVGAQANLSPRFCFHHEERGGKLVLFHGDGLPMKTYLNLKANPSITRVVLDPETFTGYVGEGLVEEFRPTDFPAAYERICTGFTNGAWGRPARVFRHVIDRWSRLSVAA